MKAVVTAVALAVAATVAVMNVTGPVQAGHEFNLTPQYDDGWDSEKRKCRRNKRKCVEVASNIAYNMARSGAYADLNDDDFARLAIYIAAHIVDNAYKHDEESPLDGGGLYPLDDSGYPLPQ